MRLTIVAIVVLFAFSPVLSQESGHKYVGVSKCKTCHKTKKTGNQFEKWQNGPHAKAFEILATEESKAIAKEKGIDDPQKSDQCLSCHVTANGVAAELKEETLTMEEGVSCEQCHGPGSGYKKMSIMKDRAKAIEAGLLIPDEKTCLACHNENSPTYKPFVFEERVLLIAHPVPSADEQGE